MDVRVALADEIVKEYLVRRGFVNALEAFERDTASDALQGFQVPPIYTQQYITFITHTWCICFLGGEGY